MASIAAFLGIYVGIEVLFGGFIYSYGVLHVGMSSQDGRLLTAVYWGCLALGRLAAVPLSMVATPLQMMTADLAGCVLAALAVALVPGTGSLWVATGLFGFSMASIFPSAFNIASSCIHVSGKVASFFVVWSAFGEMILPAVAGALFAQVGPASFPPAVVGGACVQAGVFAFCLRFSRKLEKAAGRGNS